MARVAEHESEPRDVSGLRSSVDPTRIVVFGPGAGGVTGTVSGLLGPFGQSQGLGAASAEVAKVARAAAKMVKTCMMTRMRMGLTMLGEEKREIVLL